jgi:hypothetical protein
MDGIAISVSAPQAFSEVGPTGPPPPGGGPGQSGSEAVAGTGVGAASTLPERAAAPSAVSIDRRVNIRNPRKSLRHSQWSRPYSNVSKANPRNIRPSNERMASRKISFQNHLHLI